jgi:hypothetical protein
MPSSTIGPGRDHAHLDVGRVPMLGADASTPSYLLGLWHELSPTSLKLGVKLKGHSTLSPPYPEPELIIMMPIIIPLNTNK